MGTKAPRTSTPQVSVIKKPLRRLPSRSVIESTSYAPNLEKRGLDAFYMTDAPQPIKILTSNFCDMERKVADLCPRVVDEFNTLNRKSAKSKFSVIAELKRTIEVIAESTSSAYQYKPGVVFDITDLKVNSMYPGTECLQAVVLVNKKKTLRANLMRKDCCCSWGQGTTKMSYMKGWELNSLYKYSQRQRKNCRGNSCLPMKVLLSCS